VAVPPRGDYDPARMQFRVFYIVNLPADHMSAHHAHSHWEIVYVVGSGGYIEVDGWKTSYQPGDLLIHSPATKHLSYSRNPGAHYCLGIVGVELSRLADRVLHAPRAVRDLFMGIAAELESAKPCYREIIEAKAAEIAWHVMRALGAEPERLEAEPAGALKLLLDREWRSKKELGELTGQLLVSKDYLRHVFKKEYGVSPVKYIILKRIQNAKELLASSHRSIKSIAFECGFESEHYFSRLFRKVAGVSPTDYRARSAGK
jgi:AraC-like DNA-binding protein